MLSLLSHTIFYENYYKTTLIEYRGGTVLLESRSDCSITVFDLTTRYKNLKGEPAEPLLDPPLRIIWLNLEVNIIPIK